MSDYVKYEDVTVYGLTPEREQELLAKQEECTFMWVSSEQQPVGVIMHYVYRNGSIWVTATRQRARIKALQRNPRASVTISGMGTDMGGGKSITYIGKAVLHEDQATKDWFYPAIAELITPYPAPTVEAAIDHLDTPLRVIIEVIPERTISFDGERLAKQLHNTEKGG